MGLPPLAVRSLSAAVRSRAVRFVTEFGASRPAKPHADCCGEENEAAVECRSPSGGSPPGSPAGEHCPCAEANLETASMPAFLAATLLLLAQPQTPTPRTWDVDGVKREALVYAPSKK